MHFEKPIIFRSLLSVVLGAAAVTLFLMNETVSKQYEAEHQDIRALQKLIDGEIESALARSGVEQKWIRKQTIPLANTNFSRIERRVAVPPEFLSLQLNAALNSMAHRYNGRAIGTEDLKQHTVSIHIELPASQSPAFSGTAGRQRVIVETIILKTRFDLKRKT